MKNTIGKNIKRIRQSKKITQKQLSELTGFSQNGISNHENGNRNIDEIDIMMYAKALGVRPQDLFESEPSKQEVIKAVSIPVVSQISAGEPLYSEENILEYSYAPADLLKKNIDYFYLKVTGDSMNKEFNEGDLLLIEKDAPIENGQIGIVQFNGYEATVKRVRYDEDKVYLMPESTNPDHLPQVYDKQDDVHFIGRVIMATSQKMY